MEIVLLPDEIIELNKELATDYHPELEKRLQEVGGSEDQFIERFATICAHCEIALDGMYTSDQMLAVIRNLVLERLRARRVNPHKLIIVS